MLSPGHQTVQKLILLNHNIKVPWKVSPRTLTKQSNTTQLRKLSLLHTTPGNVLSSLHAHHVQAGQSRAVQAGTARATLSKP